MKKKSFWKICWELESVELEILILEGRLVLWWGVILLKSRGERDFMWVMKYNNQIIQKYFLNMHGEL